MNAVIDPLVPVQVVTYSPLMTQQTFSELVGVTQDTVRGWLQTGTVPSIKVGRLRLVDVDTLVQQIRAGKADFSSADFIKQG